MQDPVNIICHLFYPELGEQVLDHLRHFQKSNTYVFVNIQGDTPAHKKLYEKLISYFNNVRILLLPDKGRDIGAKLSLIHLSLLLNNESEYTLIVHDKKSLYNVNGRQWREELYKIIYPQYSKRIESIFRKNPETGIICSGNYIQNEYDESSKTFLSNNHEKIIETLKEYNIVTNDYSFVAGNIFWIRTLLLKNFFKDRSILKIKSQLEAGNALDFDRSTYVHTWERIMSWIATSQGYKIYGI